jgi:hypothetical protein
MVKFTMFEIPVPRESTPVLFVVSELVPPLIVELKEILLAAATSAALDPSVTGPV